MESIKNIAARHKMSEGAIKQNLLRNKKETEKDMYKFIIHIFLSMSFR